jgi:hypothetical protein
MLLRSYLEIHLLWFSSCFILKNLDDVGCFKKSFTVLKVYINRFKGHAQCFNCHNVAKHRVLPGWLRFNATSTGNAGCFKKCFTMVFQMLLCGECYENVQT